MGKKSKTSLGWLDIIEAFSLIICLGLGIEPFILWLYSMDIIYVWYLFSIALILIVAGVALGASKRFIQIALFAFAIGMAWFIQTTLLLCSYMQTSFYV